MRDRRDGPGDARAHGRLRRGAGARGADAARALRPRLRRRVPVGDPRLRRLDRHRRSPGRTPDPRHELVSPRRGPLRRVRLQLPRGPALRDRPPADRHRLQHEPRPPRVGDADRVRDARRRRRAHGRHHLPDVPRAPPPRAPARHRADARRLDADAPRGDGPARAVLRRHLRLAPDRLPLGTGHARRARPPLRLRVRLPGRARPVRLPAALAARQRLVLAQVRARGAGSVDRPGRPPARARAGGLRRRRRVPRRARGDRAGRPLAGAGHRHDRPAGRARRAGCARTLAILRRSPWRRAAHRRLPLPARGDGLRAARGRARRDARLGGHARPRHRGRRARHVARARRPRRAAEGVIASPPTASCASPGRAARGSARQLLERRRAAGRARRGRRRRSPADPRLPGRARPRVGGAHVPDLGRGAAVGRAGLRVPRLGSPGARRRRQPRLAARRRLARRARDLRARRPATAPSQWAIRDIAPLVLGHFGCAGPSPTATESAAA